MHLFLFLFLVQVMIQVTYAQNWLRMEGNELIDIEAYQEIDIARPPFFNNFHLILICRHIYLYQKIKGNNCLVLLGQQHMPL